jgi:hypothetical protein
VAAGRRALGTTKNRTAPATRPAPLATNAPVARPAESSASFRAARPGPSHAFPIQWPARFDSSRLDWAFIAKTVPTAAAATPIPAAATPITTSGTCGSGDMRTCSAQCQWGACSGQTCTGPTTQAFGNCGTQSRTCDNGAWSSFGACAGEGCAPNSMQACAGGTQTCNAECQWGACVPATCASVGWQCGSDSDGCGGRFNCPACPPRQRCDTTSHTCELACSCPALSICCEPGVCVKRGQPCP